MIEVLLAIATLCQVKDLGLGGYECKMQYYGCQAVLAKCVQAEKKGTPAEKLLNCLAKRADK